VTECICSRHGISPDCPVHRDPFGSLGSFMAAVNRNRAPSVLDDPDWRRADEERWDHRKAQEARR
jgi:hypothetical protein